MVVGLRDRGRGLVKSKRERSVAARIGSNLEISSGQCGCQPVEGGKKRGNCEIWGNNQINVGK